MPTYTLEVNGQQRSVEADADMPLLYALRGDLGQKGPKFGCGLSQCGACTVIYNGNAVRSCILPVSAAINGNIRTLDGLGTADNPHPVQAAFIAEEAAQCGYCSNGWIMTATAALEQNPRRSDSDIRNMLTGLKCRCGTHMAIMRAVRQAADAMSLGQPVAGTRVQNDAEVNHEQV
jgi:aerobic-type carbon monoxide dehydrogenase small subunit (CoxS/CutS family)